MARPESRTRPSPQRDAIYRAIVGRPGITITELSDQFDMGWSSLYYHLERLQKGHRIKTRRKGKNRLLYPSKGTPTVRLFVLGATAREIALAIVRRPGTSMKDLFRDLRLTPRVLYYHVDRLIESGLVRSSSRTRYLDLKPTDRLFHGLGLKQPQKRLQKGSRRG